MALRKAWISKMLHAPTDTVLDTLQETFTRQSSVQCTLQPGARAVVQEMGAHPVIREPACTRTVQSRNKSRLEAAFQDRCVHFFFQKVAVVVTNNAEKIAQSQGDRSSTATRFFALLSRLFEPSSSSFIMENTCSPLSRVINY